MRFIKTWYEGEAAATGEVAATGTESTKTGSTPQTVAFDDNFDFATVLPEDLKADKSLEKYATHKGKAWVENVTRSLVSAQKMIGADPNEIVRVPADPTKISATDRAKFMERLGLPKDEKAYELKNVEKPIAGFEPDGELGKWFSKTAKDAGLFPDQAQGLYAAYVEQMRGAMSRQANEFAAVDRANVESLQKEFGKAFDGELKAARFGAAKLGGDEFIKRIGDLGLGTDPVFVKAMAKYGRAMAEGGEGGDKGNSFNTGALPAAALAEGNRLLREAMEIMDSNPGKARELNLKAQEVFARNV